MSVYTQMLNDLTYKHNDLTYKPNEPSHQLLIDALMHRYCSDRSMRQLCAPAGTLQIFWIGLKRSDVTVTSVYIFQDGCRTKSLRKIRPSYWWWRCLDPIRRRRLYLLQMSLIFSSAGRFRRRQRRLDSSEVRFDLIHCCYVSRSFIN